MIEKALEVACPACGEPTTLWVTVPDERHREESDCEVCCRPYHVVTEVHGGEVWVVEVGPGW